MTRLWAAAAVALVMAQASPSKEPLRVAVNTATVESAPVFLAAQGAADREMTLTGGGIPLLVNRTADAATNSETQILLRSVESPDLRVVMTVAECERDTLDRCHLQRCRNPILRLVTRWRRRPRHAEYCTAGLS